MIKHIDLFSGIGGFALGCHWASQSTGIPVETILFCERDEFCHQVLRKYWADVPIVGDINNVAEIKAIANSKSKQGSSQQSIKRVRGQKQEQPGGDSSERTLLTGGFPCQPFSVAGKRQGSEDSEGRYLWDETLAIIRATDPHWCILENVPGILSMVFPDSGIGVENQASIFGDKVQGYTDYQTISGKINNDLQEAGFETVWLIIPACSVGAPHQRYRIFLVANSKCLGWSQRTGQGIQPTEQVAKGQDIGNLGSERVDTHTDRAGSRTSSGGINLNREKKNKRQSQQPQSEYSGQSGDATNSNSGGLERAIKVRRNSNNVEREDSTPTNTKAEGLYGDNPTGQVRSRGRSTELDRIPEWGEDWITLASELCRVGDGIPDRVDRLKSLGNALIPQIVAELVTNIIRTEYT